MGTPWVEGQQGEILVHSDAGHEKSKAIKGGRFYAVDFHDDPDFRDSPHLFLENGGVYEEVMIPNGLPTERDHQKLVVRTGETLSKEKLAKHLQEPEKAEQGESRSRGGRSGSEAPIANYEMLSVDAVRRKLNGLDRRELERLKRYEEEHRNRKTVRDDIDRRLHRAEK